MNMKENNIFLSPGRIIKGQYNKYRIVRKAYKAANNIKRVDKVVNKLDMVGYYDGIDKIKPDFSSVFFK